MTTADGGDAGGPCVFFVDYGSVKGHEEGVADTVFPPTVREHPPIDRQVGEVSAGVPRQHCGGPDTAGHCQQGRDRAHNQDRYWGTLTTRAGMDIWLLLVKNGYARSEG